MLLRLLAELHEYGTVFGEDIDEIIPSNVSFFPSHILSNKLLKAVLFASQKHENQRRKNSADTPYINHPIEVAEYLNRVGGVDDLDVLVAAILHDTIEDTETTEDEIYELFGETVRRLVMECTDNKQLAKADRKRLQIETAPKKSHGGKQIKLADKACNLKSILVDPPKAWSIERQREYFEWAAKVCNGLKGVNAALDHEIDKIINEGTAELAAR